MLGTKQQSAEWRLPSFFIVSRSPSVRSLVLKVRASASGCACNLLELSWLPADSKVLFANILAWSSGQRASLPQVRK